MGELYCTHAREEVRRGQPERTKWPDDPGVKGDWILKKNLC
jgi:hypothetical protein